MSFPPVPSTEITNDGKNLSPAWIAFFSQVFSNGGISAAAVNNGTPTFSGNVTVTNLTVTGTSSVAGAAGFASTVSFNGEITANSTATFNGPLTANSTASFAGGFTSTTGTFTSRITGTTMTLSGLATFNAGATGTNASFTTGSLGNYSWSTNDMTSSDQMNFYTVNSDIPASVLAMNIDNQQRLNFPAVSTAGLPLTLFTPLNFYQEGRTYTDLYSTSFFPVDYCIGSFIGPSTLAADQTGVVYKYGAAVWIYNGISPGTNITINERLALVTGSGNVNFSDTFYIGGGSGSVATSNASGAFVSKGVLGYGKDAFANSPGGAVTQNTSKSQGVTLNKGCGVITMNAAALNAGTSVEFVLTNSFIAATDTVICNMGPGGTASTYLVQCQAVAAGSCRFRVSNYSATNRSEACVVNFSIIKATNA